MNQGPYWIGVDLHTRVIQVCVLDSSSEVIHQDRRSGPTLEDGLELVEELAKRFPGAHLAVEALGTNRWFVAACEEHGLRVTVAHATHLALKLSGRKCDRRDAFELARRHRLGDIEKNAKAYHPTAEEYGWRQLFRHRHSLVARRTEVVCQIRALLRSHRAESPRGDLYAKRNLAKLRTVRLQDECEQIVLTSLIDLLTSTHEIVQRLHQACAELTKRQERIAPLLQLPYVGTVIAGTIAAELGDVHRFRSAKAVASYAGLVPRVVQSANRDRGGPLVRHGNRELRFVLGEWAVQLLTKHPEARAWAQSRLTRMPKNKVRVSLARKLLIGVWHCMRTGEAFSLPRCLATA